jgi:hypothetical protein
VERPSNSLELRPMESQAGTSSSVEVNNPVQRAMQRYVNMCLKESHSRI